MSGDLFFYGLMVLAMIAVVVRFLTGDVGAQQGKKDDDRRI